LGAGEVPGGASGMIVDRIGEVGNWTLEGYAAGVYGQVLQRVSGKVGARVGSRLVLTRSCRRLGG
jgi:hypothetical protein